MDVVRPTQGEIARALEIDAALVTRYKARGMPVDSVEAARRWKADNVRAKVTAIGQAETAAPRPADALAPPAPPAAPTLADTGYTADRARREKYDADMAEIKLREQQGDLVHWSTVRAEMTKRLGDVRTNLLQIPARLAPLLAPELDQTKVYALLDAELRTVLTKLTSD